MFQFISILFAFLIFASQAFALSDTFSNAFVRTAISRTMHHYKTISSHITSTYLPLVRNALLQCPAAGPAIPHHYLAFFVVFIFIVVISLLAIAVALNNQCQALAVYIEATTEAVNTNTSRFDQRLREIELSVNAMDTVVAEPSLTQSGSSSSSATVANSECSDVDKETVYNNASTNGSFTSELTKLQDSLESLSGIVADIDTRFDSSDDRFASLDSKLKQSKRITDEKLSALDQQLRGFEAQMDMVMGFVRTFVEPSK
ncbi:hypothetical protein H4219_005273 [Mycoemilia scoparia]|uniref:Uncharacterized protein n=1 Tax=Mycoemilia scoparia TaxID=417184 RepID=A0A9W7ZNM6_9FUNG|nr:hypothetical protein H4219_005273 [Mycoemilia scoparia]